MTDLEKGYAAGLMDGEGTITLMKDRADAKFKYPVVEMTSTTYELLLKMKELANGGTICNKTTYNENHKQAQRQYLKGDKAITFLSEIKDYLLEPKKKARANLIVNEYKIVTPRNGYYSEKKLTQKLDFEKRFFEL